MIPLHYRWGCRTFQTASHIYVIHIWGVEHLTQLWMGIWQQTHTITTTKEANKQTMYMPRSISSSHSDEDSSVEVSTPHLPTLTRSQRRRFLEDQKRIIRHFIRSYARDRTVFYISFDTPGVFDAELEELLGETTVIYEIIFDQTSRTVFTYYRRDLPHSTFTRVRGGVRDKKRHT